MSQFVVPFVLRHFATTTVVSTFTLAITLYKFCHHKNHTQKTKSGSWIIEKYSSGSNKDNNRLVRGSRSRDRNAPIDCIIHRAPMVTIMVFFSHITNRRAEAKLREIQIQLSGARQLLYALDQWLEIIQHRLYLFQSQLSGRRQEDRAQIVKDPGLTLKKAWFRRRRIGFKQ